MEQLSSFLNFTSSLLVVTALQLAKISSATTELAVKLLGIISYYQGKSSQYIMQT